MQRIWKAREFARLLEENGYSYTRCNGDHMIYRNLSGRIISFNCRGLNRMVAQRLIKEYELEVV